MKTQTVKCDQVVKCDQTVKWLDYYWELRTIYHQPVVTEDGVKGMWGMVPVIKIDDVWYEDFEVLT